jgi:hypothetical protein
MSNSSNQHGGTSDGKTFPAKAPESSPPFGQRENSDVSTKPGQPQTPPPYFDPAQ